MARNKIFKADEVKAEQVGVNRTDHLGVAHPPLSKVDVSGDVFANQYQFGMQEGEVLITNNYSNVVVDFNNDIVQTILLDTDEPAVITTTNRTTLDTHLKASTVKFLAVDANRALEFDNAIKFLGNIPTGLAKGKIGVLSLNSFGPLETDTVAVYRTEGEYLVGICEPAVLFNSENNITGECCFTYDIEKDPKELHVGGHVLPCTGEHLPGTFNLGGLTEYWRSLYLAGKEITIDNVNAKYYVPRDEGAVQGTHTDLPTGPENTGSSTVYDEFISKEIILTTKELNFGYTGEHIIELPTGPDNKTFYVDEVGIVITHSAGVGAPGGISIKFGYENLQRTETEALIDELFIEPPLDIYDRERFMTPKNSCGIGSNLMATITTGIKHHLTNAELYGRIYYKGMFIEDEY